MMKKIINDPNHVVKEMLQGMVKLSPKVKLLPGYDVVVRAEKADKVAILTGGGSGHEPAHAGYVGYGMLDAAVAGNVFASPGADAVEAALEAVDAGKGVLMVIKNYSGDIMNFTMAKELAEMEGVKADYVVVKDDVAVPDSTYSAGRRGIAGTVFVHKLAGAKAELGGTLEEVKAVAQKTIDNVRSMGASMASCVLPGVGKPGFTLGEEEIEIGMGIHNEPGIQRTTMMSARELAEILLEKILADYDYEGAEVAVMVNGLGGTPLMELYILYNEVEKLLTERGITVYRAMAGNYMTSLEMPGCSLSLLKLDEELKTLLDAPCDTLGWAQHSGL